MEATTAGGQQEPRGKRKLSKKERQALKRQRSALQARAGPPAATQSQNPSKQKKKGKGRKGKQPASDRADSPAAAPDAAAGGAGPAVLQAPMSAPMSAAAQAQLDAIASGSVKVRSPVIRHMQNSLECGCEWLCVSSEAGVRSSHSWRGGGEGTSCTQTT